MKGTIQRRNERVLTAKWICHRDVIIKEHTRQLNGYSKMKRITAEPVELGSVDHEVNPGTLIYTNNDDDDLAGSPRPDWQSVRGKYWNAQVPGWIFLP